MISMGWFGSQAFAGAADSAIAPLAKAAVPSVIILLAADIKASLFVLCAADLVVGSIVSASLVAAAATYRLAYIIHNTNTNLEPLQAEATPHGKCSRSKKRCNAKKSDGNCEMRNTRKA